MTSPQQSGTSSRPARGSLTAPGFDYVPKHGTTSDVDVAALREFILKSKKLMVLTGAGISTESGIPDYRSEGVGVYAKPNNTSRPVLFQDFMNIEMVRRQYWARDFVEWPRFSALEPNPAHKTLAKWEKEGKIHWLVTQNIDKLHEKAGSTKVSELHGNGHWVRCRSCEYRVSRAAFQDTLAELNPTIASRLEDFQEQIRPDDSLPIYSDLVQAFKVPPCPSCETGILQTEIVFFGDGISKETVLTVGEKVMTSDALLVIGSSLTVSTSYRIFELAHEHLQLPIAIVNIGPTKADDEDGVLYFKCRAGDLLPRLGL